MSVNDKYEIAAKVLGKGGYGETHAGKVKATGEPIAIKLIDTRRMAIKAIEKEVQIQTMMSHPNIVKVSDAGVGTGRQAHIYFVYMELASGGELFDQVIDRGAQAMPEPVARGYYTQLVSAVACCHHWGVAHRDLKLENALLDDRGVVKLIDFGLSHIYPRDVNKQVDRSKRLRDICGSRSYCAPEVLSQLPYDGFEADVWSLGVCLFAMVSGFFPLDEASEQDWRYKLLKKQQQAGGSTVVEIYKFYKRPTGHLSAELKHLLDGMLRIDPAKRFTLAEVANHPWMLEQKFVEASSHEVNAEEFPVYRGIGEMRDNDYSMDTMEEDDMPVYRSLGGAMEDMSMAMPGLTRQTGNVNLLLGETGIIGDDFC